MTVYLYVILQRLTDEELQMVKTKYHTHIIDLQSQSKPNVQKNSKGSHACEPFCITLLNQQTKQ